MITNQDLDLWFEYHKPTETQLPKYVAIRAAAKQFAATILKHTPPSADQTAAIRMVRESVMTANAAIACNPVSAQLTEPQDPLMANNVLTLEILLNGEAIIGRSEVNLMEAMAVQNVMRLPAVETLVETAANEIGRIQNRPHQPFLPLVRSEIRSAFEHYVAQKPDAQFRIPLK